jgi:hypothetical protein
MPGLRRRNFSPHASSPPRERGVCCCHPGARAPLVTAPPWPVARRRHPGEVRCGARSGWTSTSLYENEARADTDGLAKAVDRAAGERPGASLPIGQRGGKGLRRLADAPLTSAAGAEVPTAAPRPAFLVWQRASPTALRRCCARRRAWPRFSRGLGHSFCRDRVIRTASVAREGLGRRSRCAEWAARGWWAGLPGALGRHEPGLFAGGPISGREGLASSPQEARRAARRRSSAAI